MSFTGVRQDVCRVGVLEGSATLVGWDRRCVWRGDPMARCESSGLRRHDGKGERARDKGPMVNERWRSKRFQWQAARGRG